MPIKPWIVVIGASAGGVSALTTLVRGLPRNLNAAVYVVLHVPSHSPSHLSEILGRCAKLPVLSARDEDPIRPGHIVVAQADHHLMIEPAKIRVIRGPRESLARPSIDVLFRSAATAHGHRVIGVVLTGMRDDGTAGLWAIKDRGGVALVQDPASAEFPAMAQSAIANVEVDRVLVLPDLAEELIRRVNNEITKANPVADFASTWRHAEKHLSPVVGTQAVAVLFKRSLMQMVRSHDWLSNVLKSFPGNVDAAVLSESLNEQAAEDAAVVCRELLQTFYGLVTGLIGAPLTKKLTSSDQHGRAQHSRTAVSSSG